MKELVYKEFGFTQELCDFVNKNKIAQNMVCQVVRTDYNVGLFYWRYIKK